MTLTDSIEAMPTLFLGFSLIMSCLGGMLETFCTDKNDLDEEESLVIDSLKLPSSKH